MSAGQAESYTKDASLPLSCHITALDAAVGGDPKREATSHSLGSIRSWLVDPRKLSKQRNHLGTPVPPRLKSARLVSREVPAGEQSSPKNVHCRRVIGLS